MKLKYVIIEFDGINTPFIFPELPNHVDVANALSESFWGGKIISGGFCWFDYKNNTWAVYGESTSLKMKSRPIEDVAIFNSTFRVQ